MPDKRYARRHRNREIVRQVLDGSTLAVIAIEYGISRERVRQLFNRAIGRLADAYHEPAPTIPQARQNATRWRALLGQHQHEEATR